MLDVAEDSLHLGGADRSQSFPFWAGQIGPGFFSVFEELETDADSAVAFGFGILASEGTVGAILAGMAAPVGDIAIKGVSDPW